MGKSDLNVANEIIFELQDRIDEAIEYINSHKEYLKRLDEQGAYYSTIEVRMCDEMIHILKREE